MQLKGEAEHVFFNQLPSFCSQSIFFSLTHEHAIISACAPTEIHTPDTICYTDIVTMTLFAIPNALLLPVETIRLGEFTTNIAAVQENQKFPEGMRVPDSITTDIEYAAHTTRSNSTSRFKAALSRLISTNFANSSGRTFSFAPGRGRSYLLRNVTAWFNQAADDDDVKLWIQERAANTGSIYMITGIQTLINPRVIMDIGRTSQSEINVGVPLPLGPGISLVPTLAGGHQAMHSQQLEFAVSGERILALQYRKLKFRFRNLLDKNDPQLSELTRSWNCIENQWRGADESDDEGGSITDEIDESIACEAIEVSLGAQSCIPDGDWLEETGNDDFHSIVAVWNNH